MKIDTHTQVIDGYTVHVSIHHDENMGEPWKENDGHGIVSEWVSRSKSPGELVLCSDRSRFKRFYDFSATLELAKRDGWGLNPEAKDKLAATLGRKPTAMEIRVQAVNLDFQYCKGYCNDDWHWLGYTTQIETPQGNSIQGDSCWGFEGVEGGLEYMIGEAISQAESEIERHKALLRETAIAECCP